VQRQSGTQSLLNAVAYGNGLFVAVGVQIKDITNQVEESSIVTSTDGVNWVASSTAMQGGTAGIAYGNGEFVAVGGLGEIETSYDSSNWLARSFTVEPWFDGSPSGIAYGNGHFVAVSCCGRGSAIITSADGVNWRLSYKATWNYFSGVAYGNGRFVVVGRNGVILQSGPIIRLSITANTDTKLPSLSISGPAGLAYTIQTSADLISWQNLTNITTAIDGRASVDVLPAAADRLFYRAYSQ
jgi:hypothetical protein